MSDFQGTIIFTGDGTQYSKDLDFEINTVARLKIVSEVQTFTAGTVTPVLEVTVDGGDTWVDTTTYEADYTDAPALSAVGVTSSILDAVYPKMRLRLDGTGGADMTVVYFAIPVASAGAAGAAAGGAVDSVFGRTGAVVSASGDYDDSQVSAAAAATNYTPTGSNVEGHLAGIDTALGSAGSVDSVFGRTGVVVAVSGDYEDSEITAAPLATNYTPLAANVFGHLNGIDTALGAIAGENWSNTNLTFTAPRAHDFAGFDVNYTNTGVVDYATAAGSIAIDGPNDKINMTAGLNVSDYTPGGATMNDGASTAIYGPASTTINQPGDSSYSYGGGVITTAAVGSGNTMTVDAVNGEFRLNGTNILDSALSKTLASGNFYVGSLLGAATAVTMSGDATMDELGAVTIATFLGAPLGAKGLVPAPSPVDDGNFLKGDGTWSAPTNIYSADDALTGNRQVDMAGNTLNFINNSGFSLTNGGNNHSFTANRHTITSAAVNTGSWLSMNDGTDSFGIYGGGGTPEGNMIANIGAIYLDTTNAKLYQKGTDTVNTGWTEVGADTSFFTSDLVADAPHSHSDDGHATTIDGGGSFAWNLAADSTTINYAGLTTIGGPVTGTFTNMESRYTDGTITAYYGQNDFSLTDGTDTIAGGLTDLTYTDGSLIANYGKTNMNIVNGVENIHLDENNLKLSHTALVTSYEIKNDGTRIQTRAAAGEWAEHTDGTDTFKFFNNAGTPEGSVAGDIGSECIDTTNGVKYIKTADTTAVGWQALASIYEQAVLVANWVSVALNQYTLTIPAATHKKGVYVGQVVVQEDDGTNYISFTPDAISITKVSGDIVITIDGATDPRIDCRVLVY